MPLLVISVPETEKQFHGAPMYKLNLNWSYTEINDVPYNEHSLI